MSIDGPNDTDFDPRIEQKLIKLLQGAYSGELGAEKAYGGHAISVKDGQEKDEILTIRQEELDHRQCVGTMLTQMGAKPNLRLEKRVGLVGSTLSFMCRFTGWFLPMYGAAWLERKNIEEYVHAAQLAQKCGRENFLPDLLEMAQVEWDHELYFRQKAETHWMWKFFPHWPLPTDRENLSKAIEMD